MPTCATAELCWYLLGPSDLSVGAGAVVCAGSFVSALLLALLSAFSPPQSKQSALRKRRMSVEQAAAAQEEGETIRCAHAKHFNASFWLICTIDFCPSYCCANFTVC